MSLELVLNFLSYDLRPHLEYCLGNVQQSLSRLFSLLGKSLWGPKTPPFKPWPCQEDPTHPESHFQQKSQEIWQAAHPDSDTKEWVEKNEFGKLLFYWMAVGGDPISEDPFENFKFFADSQAPDRMEPERCLKIWYAMSRNQRLPFRFEACLARMASGKINFRNQREVRDYMSGLSCSQ